jgi:hypothetical protein
MVLDLKAKKFRKRTRVTSAPDDITTMFSDSKFATPMFVHSQVPPGVPTMQQERNFTYTFEGLAAGSSVRIKSSNTEAVKAAQEPASKVSQHRKLRHMCDWVRRALH